MTTSNDIGRLAALVRQERQSLLANWRAQVKTLPSARHLDTPTLNDHIPGLIDELAIALGVGSEQTIAEAVVEGTPPAHGVQRYQDGFDIDEVVAEYNILRGCIHDLADSNELLLQGEPFRVLNRVLDGAIGSAVQAFSEQRAHEVQRRRDEYLTFVAHDLRSPLNAIALTLNFLEHPPAANGGQHAVEHMWKILRRNVQQLESLVGKILRENINIEAEAGFKVEQRLVDLWPLVESVNNDLQPIAKNSGTRLDNAVPDELLLFADASMVRRVFQNLIANAISYAPGGRVVIGARPMADGAFLECWVTDDGEGIPQHRLERIFDMLETDASRGDRGGHGLGLAIVKAFVEAHGGQVSVVSEPGDGSTFRFTLPTDRPSIGRG